MNITLLADIAGRVARDTYNADRVTVGGVAVPSGALKSIRKCIPKHLPKWRDATDSDVELVVNLLIRETLGVSAVSVEKEPVAWESFWGQSADIYSRIVAVSGEKLSFIKAATVIKYALFGQASSLTMSQAILNLHFVSPNKRKPFLIRKSLILDNEIQGDDNIETFLELWDARNASQPLTNLLGVHMEVTSMSMATEQEEPLLLLPDYVAGLVHAAYSNAETLSASKVSKLAAEQAHARLKKFRKYAEISEPFSYKYHDVFPSLDHLLKTAS